MAPMISSKKVCVYCGYPVPNLPHFTEFVESILLILAFLVHKFPDLDQI